MATIDTVDSVLRMLSQDHHRETLIDYLFPGSHPDYRAEWMRRDAYGFWCHLDDTNRERVVKFCVDYYR